MLCSHNYVERQWLNYMDGLLSIMIYEEEIITRTYQWLFNIQDLNKEHVILPYNVNIYNIPEEEKFITCMTPTGFINGHDESICYVN